MDVKELRLKDWHLRATGVTLAERMMRTARTAASFRDLELKFAMDSGGIVLCQAELNLLINTVLTGLSAMNDVLDYGSLAVCSQDLDGEVTWILRTDLRNGPSMMPGLDGFEPRTSRVEVLNLIQDTLNYGCDAEQKAMRGLNLPRAERVESRIYAGEDANMANVLVANADQGRYMAAFIGCRMFVPSVYPLAMVMQTLACLHEDDVELQKSADLVARGLELDEYNVAAMLMRDITSTFAGHMDPLLQEWREWLYNPNKR